MDAEKRLSQVKRSNKKNTPPRTANRPPAVVYIFALGNYQQRQYKQQSPFFSPRNERTSLQTGSVAWGGGQRIVIEEVQRQP